MQYTIKELRARVGLTQRGLADKIGVSDATVRKWERFPGQIQVHKLQALADIFHVRIDEIFVGYYTAFNSENTDE